MNLEFLTNWQSVSIPIANSEQRFPVGRIFCVGRNYASHAIEMGSDPNREQPFFFSKLADAVVAPRVNGFTQIAYPPQTQDLHHEVELVVAIGHAGSEVSASQANALIAGFAVGIDFTRRDLQAAAKANRRPWLLGKNFAGSAPVSELDCALTIKDLTDAKIELCVNGQTRQSATLSQMLWSVPDIIAELSRFLPLVPGDLIFTGTPAGVSAVNVGDRLHASVTDLPTLDIQINEPLAT